MAQQLDIHGLRLLSEKMSSIPIQSPFDLFQQQLSKFNDIMMEALQEVICLLNSLDGRLAGLDGRLVGLDGRLAGLEGRLVGLDGRLAGLEGRLVGLEGRLVGLDGRLAGLDGRLMEFKAN